MTSNVGAIVMRKLISWAVMCLIAVPAVAMVPAEGRGRAAMADKMAGRATASKAQIASMAMIKQENQYISAPVKVDVPEDEKPEEKPEEKPVEPEKDMREREKMACINNNIGVGATFVWASRYSNTGNYASMIEDIDNPENNICWVKVGLKSTDPKINVSDIPTKYYMMGDTIICGNWTDEGRLKDRILDAKKSARTWATVGGAVGGAAVGVGAMELFGNKLLAKAGVESVQGQKALEGDELLKSQLAVLKKDKPSEYREIKNHMQNVKKLCEEIDWPDGDKPEECTKYSYDVLLGAME